ncbi:MAG: fibronectin type III domain-containing protein [Desulfuromonas sp.]|nr:fibronectin type III domain-containing protein [Desulfuromonas sp.]
MIELKWTDLGEDEDGYEIEVMVWNGRFIKTGEVPANATRYIDRVGIEPEQLYTYRVRPFRGDAKSPYSNEASAQPTIDLEDGTCLE